MDGTVIIADDDKNLRAVLTQSLSRAGAKVRATATLSTLWRWLEEGEGDVVLCDVNLADGDAIDVLPQMRAMRPDLQFVLMSAQNTVVTALRAGEAGAFDYLAKPFDLREMIETLMRAQKQVAPNAQSKNTGQKYQDLPLIGRSEVMQELYRSLSRILPSDLPVIILGETGTGKSLVAEVIHQYGGRKALPLERYDGSHHAEGGVLDAFAKAGEGSLILEKLEDFLPSEQREILQAIESKRFEARIIATASPEVLQAVENGEFRNDLFHQLNVLNVTIPSLRERPEDIGELAEYFLFEESNGEKTFDPSALARLQSTVWSGNAKELQAFVKRTVAMISGDMLSESEIEPYLPESASERPQSQSAAKLSLAVENHVRRFLKLHGNELPPEGFYGELIDQIDRPIIEVVLEITGGNQIRTAEILGINRNTLRKKIKNLDISITKSKKLM